MERRSSDEHVDQLLTRSLARAATPGSVCPAADVLSAFADGGLDPVERLQVTEHAAACSRCAQILAIVLEPAVAPATLTPPVPRRVWLDRWRWMVPIATAATVAGIWIAMRDVVPPQRTPVPTPYSESAQVDSSAPVVGTLAPANTDTPPTPPSTGAAEPTRARMSTPTNDTAPPARREASESSPTVPGQTLAAEPPLAAVPAPLPAAAPPLPAPAPPPPQAIAPAPGALEFRQSPADPAPGRGGGSGGGGRGGVAGGVVGGVAKETVTVTGETPVTDAQNARAAIILPLWRYRGTVIERSLDAGRTWTREFDPGRIVQAAAMPSPDISWFVGVRGLVVRRVGAMWSIVTAPADIDVVAVEATDERNASVTLSDKRVFATTDAGVTWTQK